jgi:hypothetical protein
MPSAVVPAAALVFACFVVTVELLAYWHRDWFADLAAWQWETKRVLVAERTLDADVAIFGTSVLFHGLDPIVVNALRPNGRVVNLALNGMALQHIAQFFRERSTSPLPPHRAVLEFRQLTVERNSWIRGPYFRFWASLGEFLESRFYYWNLPQGLAWLENRALTTYRYREAVDNWVSDSLRGFGPATDVRDRNRAVLAEMRQHLGMARAFDNAIAQVPAGSTQIRALSVDSAGLLWLHKFFDVARDFGVRVVLLVPPAPPYLVERSGPEGFRAELERQVAALRLEYPTVEIEVFESSNYELEEFADQLHLNSRGRSRLSEEFAEWLLAHP